jgi:membrane protease YdiL (CAAX protease family)
MAARRGSGFAAYLLPLVSFLLILEAKARAPESATGLFFGLQVLVPGALFVFFALRGEYRDLRGYRMDAWMLADIGVGIAGAAIWMAPFVWVDSIRPEDEGAFDPELLGTSAVGLALTLRGIGYGIVTPIVEEIFMRSWLLRYAEVALPQSLQIRDPETGARKLSASWGRRRDFRNVPIAHFTWSSFVVVMVFFIASHVPWEWPVMFVWALGSQLWFYYRKHLVAVIVLHAATNLAIFAFVVAFDGHLRDALGNPISLWFFI